MRLEMVVTKAVGFESDTRAGDCGVVRAAYQRYVDVCRRLYTTVNWMKDGGNNGKGSSLHSANVTHKSIRRHLRQHREYGWVCLIKEKAGQLKTRSLCACSSVQQNGIS